MFVYLIKKDTVYICVRLKKRSYKIEKHVIFNMGLRVGNISFLKLDEEM